MPTTEDPADDAPTPDPITEQLLFQAWAGAARAGVADDPAGAVRRAYRTMLRAVQALAWERHRRRFRVPAAAHAAFWEDFARPEVGLVDAELHRWLLEAYARCGRDGTVPAPRVAPEAAALAVEHARAFLAAVHLHLGRRPPFPPEAAAGA